MRQRGFLMVYLLIGLGITVAIGVAAKKVYNAGEDSVRAEWAAANETQRQAEADQGATAATVKEKGDAKAKIIYRTITKTVDKFIDRPVYRTVCFDDDGLRSINAALEGALTPASEPDKRMPKALTTLRWDRSLGLAQNN